MNKRSDSGFIIPQITAAQQIRTNCLENLLAVTRRMQDEYVATITAFKTQHDLTMDAYNDFLESFSAETAMRLLQSTLELVRCFADLQPLCQDIDRVRAMVDANLATLQGLPNYARISKLTNALVIAKEGFGALFPVGFLQDLHIYVNQHSDLQNGFNQLLSQETETMQQWWGLWNRENPSSDAALEFAATTVQPDIEVPQLN